ncbi:uncharacterized protein LOC6541202 [Drosophila erecta]|uniref:F-box domain-containing protein n=1 Tax=Drosophila erecta TaxID=7220 RepID=B3N644_DROER|nr:uncharacterized protein LOC6541202 [Drosophila erecta]EDV58082.1 uncharacterized protein Dere_GG25193 [Drosophila erecta]
MWTLSPRLLKNREGKQRLLKFQVGDCSAREMKTALKSRQVHQVAQIGGDFTSTLESPSNSFSSDRPIPLAKPENEDKKVDYGELNKVFQKLGLSDQIVLYRSFHLLPAACYTLWRITRKRLDFRTLHQDLGEMSQRHLLVHMVDHFKYVYFVADKLQENLNVIESAGVKSLVSVQRCELLMEENSTKVKAISHPAGGDSAANRMAQWPLHALPKLMRNLRRLKANCEIQVHFIEHFQDLELLVLYGFISQTALTGIFERCHKLARLFLRFDCDTLSLKCIDKCSNLRDLSLTTGLFANQKDLVMKLTDLRLLELTQCQKRNELTLESLKFTLSQRKDSVELIQIDCKGFRDPNWMMEVGLDRCSRLRGLVLASCSFCDLEISRLSFPKVQKYIALTNCHDIKDYQLLDIVRKCAGLHDIYLIDCPQLSWKVLQGIYRIRKKENLSYPITVILNQWSELREAYQSMYSSYWCFKLSYLRIERVIQQCQPITDIQIFFNNSQ